MSEKNILTFKISYLCPQFTMIQILEKHFYLFECNFPKESSILGRSNKTVCVGLTICILQASRFRRLDDAVFLNEKRILKFKKCLADERNCYSFGS